MTKSRGSLGHKPLQLSEAKGDNPNNGLFNLLLNNIYMVLGYNAYNSAIMVINRLVMVHNGYWIRYQWSNPSKTHLSGVQSLPGYLVLVQLGSRYPFKFLPGIGSVSGSLKLCFLSQFLSFGVWSVWLPVVWLGSESGMEDPDLEGS